jgi:SAM-dependent methyltransferase
MARIRHSAILTREEHRNVQLHSEFRRRLPSDVRSAAVRVLDWGCGRGADVLHLRLEGFDAYGVEPALGTIDLGRARFADEGLDQAEYIRQLAPSNRCDFEPDSFDFLMPYRGGPSGLDRIS